MSRLEAGIYKGKAVAGSEQYGSTRNGKDQIVLDLALSEGSQVSTFLYFSDDAAQYSMQRLRALGWEGDDLTDLSGIDRNEVDIEIKYEEYQGEMKMKVNIVAGGTVKLQNQFDDKSKKAFAAKYKHLAKAAPRVASTNGARAASPSAAPVESDDIPF